MACAACVQMHHLYFAFKRAHHSTLKLLRPMAARHNLTPARLDLLCLIHNHRHGVEPFQIRLAERLGLARSTVCKMVNALTKAGLVERGPEVWDRRLRVVQLTRYGRHCVRRALKAIREREVERPLFKSFVRVCLGRMAATHLRLAHELSRDVSRFALGLSMDRNDFSALHLYAARAPAWDAPRPSA